MIALRPPVDAQALAREILSQNRFRVHAASAQRTAWDMFWDWLRARWSQMWDALFSHVHIGKTAGSLIADAVAFALIALVLVIAARLVLGSLRDARRADARPLEPRPDPHEIYLRSRAAAARGDYRSALAALFAAALLRLQLLGVIGDDPSRTVNQWRRAVAGSHPALASEFDAIALPFVSATYAERPALREQWLDAENAYAGLPDVSGHA